MDNHQIMNGIELAIELEGKSDETRKRYTSYVKKLMEYYEGKEISKLTEDELREYAIYLHKEKKYASRTYNCHIEGIKYVYKHVLFKEINWYKVPLKRTEHNEHPIPSTEEVTEILRKSNNLFIKSAVCLAAGSGLRISEIVKIKFGDIDSKGKTLYVYGKGKKGRYTIISEEVIKILRAYYIKERKPIAGNTYLFAERNCQGHIKSAKIGRDLKKISEKYTIHGLRRYFATTVYIETKDYELVGKYMGHKLVETTKKYIDITKFVKEIKTPISRMISESTKGDSNE